MPTGTLRDSDIVGAIADAIAKNVGKLKPQVIRYDEKGMVIKNDGLARLLALRHREPIQHVSDRIVNCHPCQRHQFLHRN